MQGFRTDNSLKSYYYWLSKIRKLALEELPHKKNGTHVCTKQPSAALTESSSEFAELSLPGRSISRSTPVAILHIESITVDLYEGTFAQMLENILKAVRSCPEIFPMWKNLYLMRLHRYEEVARWLT